MAAARLSAREETMTGKYDHDDWARADTAMSALDPDADDVTVAGVIADCLTCGWGPPHYLSIFHDIRPSSVRRVEKIREKFPNYQPYQPTGPCPIRVDWSRKNMVGIKERDCETAKRWAVEALLLGYSVFHVSKIGGSGGGQGTIAEVRQRKRERREDDARVAKRRLANVSE
jgi:hypothetical protein